MNSLSKLSLVGAIGAFCLVPLALGDTVNMTLNSAGNVVMGGVYVNPYTATVNGVSTKIVCDDFQADSYINESWSANVSTINQLSGTRWGSLADATQRYNAAAWLINKLLVPGITATQLGQISFAIWGIFTPSSLDALGAGSANQIAAQGWITTAMSNKYAAGSFSNFVIYTPIAGTATNCNGGPCASAPQEFMAIRNVSADESSAAALLLLTLSVLLGAGFLFRRRIVGLA